MFASFCYIGSYTQLNRYPLNTSFFRVEFDIILQYHSIEFDVMIIDNTADNGCSPLIRHKHVAYLRDTQSLLCQPRWLSGLRRSLVHSLMIARRSLCPEKLGSNPGQGSKGINFSGWHGLDMSVTVTKRR